MDVTDAMTPRDKLVTVSIPGSRDVALEHLRSREFSSVAVVKEENGTETFRGLISRETLIEHPDEDQLAILVEEGPTTTTDTSLPELTAMMAETGARRVPVVSDGELDGIITITDVIDAIADGRADGEQSVESFATETVTAIYTETPLDVAERELRFADSPYAIVVDDEAEIAGILTDADLIAVAEIVEGEDDTGGAMAGDDDEWMWEGIKTVGNRYYPTRNVEFPDGTVSDYMSDDLVTVSRTTTARETAQLMMRHDIEQIPLVSGGELVGIVQDMDLLEAV